MKILLLLLVMVSAQSIARLDWSDIEAEQVSADLLSKASDYPIHRIIRQSQDVEVIQNLLDRGYSLNTLDHLKRPVLICASRHARGTILIQYLLDAGADPFVHDMWGNTPLHRLAQYNPDPEAIQFFLNKGLDPAQKKYFQQNPKVYC